MTSRTFATRMTCFSLISAIETDLRHIICTMNISTTIITPTDVENNSKNRFKSHFNEDFSEENSLSDLIEFSDFSDLAKILSKNKTIQDLIDTDNINIIVAGLNNLTQPRNRICHSRPLEYNDINDLTDFSITLKKIGSNHWWTNINEALENLNNPSFALSLQIPSYWKSSKSKIYSNLPLPEFDDTGFLGRKDERHAITELIYSHTRVISLIGEGGIGKTALAIRCLYDVLESSENSENSRFDMIIWVTLKANRLTVSGIIQLRDAIVSTLGLYQDIGKSLGVNSDISLEELLEEISLYMKEFKILLCIDNLETIDKQHVRKFLAEIPHGSKVLITTRIGLGEIEYRYKLDSLDSKSSISLIRKLSILLNIDILKKRNSASLADLARRLHHNPLLIKWYVLGLGSGKRHEELLNKNSLTYQDALKFCFQNLYDQLTSVELQIIKTIACLRNSVSEVELRFILNDIKELEIAEALHNLHNSSMLKSDSQSLKQDDGIRTYTLTDIASDYLASIAPVEDAFYQLIRSKQRELKRHIETSLTEHNHYHLDITNVHAKNKDEKICAVYLKQALNLAKYDNNYEAALELVRNAKEMMPDFSECYRVNAYLLHKSPYKAQSEYESAIEYNSNSVIAYYAYSQFLLQDEDYPYALEQIDHAIKLNDDESLISFKALILTRSGDYSTAISLYEKILPVQRNNPHRKFRISTYQQVISCYKRYVERLIIDCDLPKSQHILERIYELFYEILNHDNYDDRSFSLLCQVLVISDKIDIKNKNIKYTTKTISIIEDFQGTLSVHHKIKLKSELMVALTSLYSESKNKIQFLINELSSCSDMKENLCHGIIKGIVCKAANNLSFGFIISDDNTEYFFHRGELSPQNAFDNNDEHKGIRVGFYSHNTKKGPTAKNVHLI